MHINMYQQKRNNYSLLINVLYQLDWHLGEPNKFGRGTSPYYNVKGSFTLTELLQGPRLRCFLHFFRLHKKQSIGTVMSLHGEHGAVVRAFVRYCGGIRFESLSTHHCWALSKSFISSLVVWSVKK